MIIKNKKGISLVEVIATAAILAVIMIPISLVFSISYGNFITQSDKSTAQKSARTVLYGNGKGYNNSSQSYGVISDLQRSNVCGNKIVIGDLYDVNKGHTISILDGIGLLYKYSFNGTKLEYEYRNKNGTLITEDYLNSNPSFKDVKILNFSVEKYQKGIDKDPETNLPIENDVIKVSVTVECKKSGKIVLESSYRIPIE